MNSKDEHIVSNVFDVPNSLDTEMFLLDSDQFNNSYDNYLRVNIGEPLNYALTYVIIYRPEDAIEFIANFLIDWSRKKTRQKMLDKEINNILKSIEIYHEQCLINEQEKKETKRLLIERKEKLKQEIILEYDKHLFTSYQWDFHIDSRTDDEREPSNYFQEQEQKINRQFHRTNTQQIFHTHDTATGIDDEMKTNQENKINRICCDGNLSSFTYFSKLKDKVIKCDES